MKSLSLTAILLTALGCTSVHRATAQNPGPPVPTHKDVQYDEDDPKSQLLDVYHAKSDSGTPEVKPAMVYIHGGGWRAGSKNRIPAFLAKGLSDGLFHVVSVEYRFTNVAPHPAQTDDCLRAIQYVRKHAADWHINPKKLAVTGGSAGGHLSFWVALHDDGAKPDSEDPVERESTRVSFAVPFAGPTDWSLLSTIKHDHPGYRQLVGSAPGTPVGEMDAAKMKDVSPVSFASKDDPPILFFHGDADVIVPYEHATSMEEKLKAAGVTYELITVPGGKHSVAGAGTPFLQEKALEGIQKYFLSK